MLSMSNVGRTNLPPEEMVMDTHGVKDARYYCLPPVRGDRSSTPGPHRKGYVWHLVFQGRVVGLFNNWAEAKASISGYPDSENQGFDSEEEGINTWQLLCILGMHPHPVDPAFTAQPSARAVNISPENLSPQKSAHKSARAPALTPIKREAPATENMQVLADLPILPSTSIPRPSPRPSPSKLGRSSDASDGGYVNFAIRGGGVVSSSAERSEHRYFELQRLGEEPDCQGSPRSGPRSGSGSGSGSGLRSGPRPRLRSDLRPSPRSLRRSLRRSPRRSLRPRSPAPATPPELRFRIPRGL
ncbi:hypothetical protein B0H15DRAFT_955776 [Mycena belliarum]|uniref:Ribonuclease H1 N-terminal domain-containing protein n=1 Tax=Mycena belliarum TaxID=1033014 RepID=A0AAD6TQR6_9AGAR|nr:hypothetical protein B0H15DRAFT_955776 [Mycena belliae]